MAESFEDYRTRVLSYLGKRDPMHVLATTGGRLERLLGGVPARALSRRRAPDKWSIREIVAHLADAELAIGWRFRNMIATPGVRLQWWDEHLWSQACGYARVPVPQSLRLFTSLRGSNLRLLRSTPRARWQTSYGVHDKRGRQTVAEFVMMEAAHDLNHLRQVRALLE
ncbi:MAG: DinB family protein [Vicinamibacterales bacterium]